MKTASALALGLVAVLVSLPLGAQTLGDALSNALASHPAAVAGAARAEAADLLVEAADSLTPRPPSASLATLSDRLGSHYGRQEWELELAAPLWLPGQKASQAALAASARDALRASQQLLRLQLAGELREAWWAVAAARNGEQLAQRRAHTAASLEADVQRRFQAGELARVDANLAQSENLDAQAALATARSERLQAEQVFHTLSGMAAPAVLAPEPAPTVGVAPAAIHPQLAVDRAAVQLARARLVVADATPREAPELALRVLRERSARSDPYANALGIKLTIPFSPGPRARQESAAARAELVQAEAQVALQERKLTQETAKAHRERAVAQQQLGMARERLALTADSLALAEKSFHLGESDLVALLRARAVAQEAEASLQREEIALAASQSRLNQSLGVLP
ncbi:TolC family protein [Simplicispira hankyongi]|uniref:TolC family protein n=1 Tax=Simplicispira hankyongi TaxID=2315688 RepID=A0A398C538_9BURK|nr:TolC family protein [Simplicispira hankyongi]RID98072.1 TolC family protein [Simplicispira hankyongi]